MIKGGRFELATRELLSTGFSISWFDRFPVKMAPHRFLHNTSASVTTSSVPADDQVIDSTLDEITSVVTIAATPQMPAADIMALAYAIPIKAVPGMPVLERADVNRSLREKYTCPG
ncbi:hypothetical protein [Burkholderia sp. L27(2015)]|uniref:hypothetical protein n=1 Tax=Burkholderia sp. L27(2015) TaxID=1641858 RepID=UPI00131A7482|nr:hypothetical protein [Burkholderia sp. L27(2015)]